MRMGRLTRAGKGCGVGGGSGVRGRVGWVRGRLVHLFVLGGQPVEKGPVAGREDWRVGVCSV